MDKALLARFEHRWNCEARDRIVKENEFRIYQDGWDAHASAVALNRPMPRLPSADAVFDATGMEDRHRWICLKFHAELVRQLQHSAIV